MSCYVGDWYCPGCVELGLDHRPFDDNEDGTDDESTSSSVTNTYDESDQDDSSEGTCEYLDALAEEDETEVLAEHTKVWMGV